MHTKQQLIKFMHCCGFDSICDIAFINGVELVASKMNDSENLFWRSVEVEGSGFTHLFKGSIKAVMK